MRGRFPNVDTPFSVEGREAASADSPAPNPAAEKQLFCFG
jgi:hypothetical protein